MKTNQLTNSLTRIPIQEIIKLKTQLPKSLLSFSHVIKKRLRLDWDIVLAISGEEGSGKSALAVWLGLLIDNEFDLERNIAYLPSAKQIEQKFLKLKRYSFFDVDEAAKSLHKYKWYDELQQTIVTMYATERFQNKATALLIPRFRDLTENFRNHRVKIWIHIWNRDEKKGEAVAIAYIRDPDKDVKDPWHCDKNAKLKEKRFKRQSITNIELSERISFEKRTKNFLFKFKFPPLPVHIRKVYDSLKNEFHKKEPKDKEDRNKSQRAERWKRALVKLLIIYQTQNKNVTQKDLGGIVGLPQQTVSDLLKRKKK